MKRFFRTALLLLAISTSVIACRDSKEKEEVDDVTELSNDPDAKVKVSEDGDELKIKTDEKKIKVEVNEDGSVEKKVKIDD